MRIRRSNDFSSRRGRARRGFLAWGGLVLLALLAGGLAPASASAEGWAYDLAGELMSPFCPGRTLASCPSPQAAELIQWISVQEAAGTSREEVVEILVAKWGEEILGAPPAEGITLWAYVFPIVGIVGGAGIAVWVIRRLVGGGKEMRSPVPATTPIATTSTAVAGAGDEELAQIVEQELAGRG